MASFEHKGCVVHYDVQGEGPDLLFMHGLTADRRQSIDALDQLSGYRLITVDMPGHGDTKLPAEPGAGNTLEDIVSFAAFGELAAALLDHLGVKKAIAGGISMGSGIALRLAADRPDLVSALLLVRPAWLDRPGRPHLGVIEDIGNWIAELGADGAAKRLLTHPLHVAASSDNPSCAASLEGATARPQAVEAAKVLPIMVADQPFARIGELQNLAIPALVIGNNADPLHPAMIAREISGALANSDYFHAPPKYLEPDAHKAAVSQRIAEFLEANR
ncbi:MAG: alpha/beta fold hydrolase [Alphaproteobacteria bacterium]|mgnify:CR=1 FL=1|nr:alpha/beta fold hydrolase [Alphaproteobacteria bacterium]MBT4018605.1 alpha/beta fold hydrolase [Alphaproteobacteria bacterium]MBT5158377.1 alpha/beta fold hydrolase [Alphaproteobacteria bacterium]MBT5916921.1 alpha/beta fold hydrolase [Alphaproteobacteria bacterium]MBT6385880.1 alpha/beta fold hydrolase [Alphaproteobacteria bacterium]